jgi:hypothetical protein
MMKNKTTLSTNITIITIVYSEKNLEEIAKVLTFTELSAASSVLRYEARACLT